MRELSEDKIRAEAVEKALQEAQQKHELEIFKIKVAEAKERERVTIDAMRYLHSEEKAKADKEAAEAQAERERVANSEHRKSAESNFATQQSK